MKNNSFILLVLVLTFFFSGYNTLFAQQELNVNNIASINIDDLSDAQIQKFITKVEESGYTEDQLIMMAKSRGMSELQIQKLRARIMQVRSGKTSNEQNSTLTNLRQSKLQQKKELDKEAGFDLDPNDPFFNLLGDSTEVEDEGLKVFGLEFFKNSTLTFEPGLNMPTPKNYVVGPGDEMIIDIWGASEQTYQLMVSPEGSIRVPNLGPIYVSGLTVEALKSKVISRLKKIYSTIGRGSYADVTLGQIRSTNVHVIGEVKKPGTYTLSSFGTVFNALYSAGGPTEDGSFRKIEIYRSRELISTLDAYKFLVEGTGENITLQDQDVVIVRPYTNRIIFDGEVKNPAIYEILDDETFEDLLLYSGGFTDKAYRGVVNLRRVEKNRKTVRSIDLDSVGNFNMKNGDEIYVSKITNEFIDRVTLEGPVMNPGEYELREEMTLLQLINKADGLKGDVFMERGVIIRQNTDFTLASTAFDPKKILSGEESIVLENNDIVKFQSIYDLREEYHITIEGEVQRPGKFSYASGMTVENLIFLAGGFKESASKSFVEVARRINPDSAKDFNNTAEIFNFSISKNLSLSREVSQFTLEPFDLVVIRRSPFFDDQEVIRIEGEVKYPGMYALDQKDERISSVLKRSGGLTNFAYSKGATLIRRTEFYIPPEFLSEDDEGNVIVKKADGGDASKIRREDLTYLFKRDTLFADSAQIFRQQESIGIELDKVLKDPGGKFDLILREGDILSIPRALQTVRVRGEVLYPSNVRHDNNYGFKKFVASAGGFDQDAKKSKSYVIYANGLSAQTKSFLFFKSYPKVEPGAEIVVPRKPEKTPLTAQAWVAMASSIATLALVIDRLVN
ncbi:protein involved in polysaccharide export, contains SLBB domain of the beta-grasp fold [Reichenbachiella faecimaris]|uniref:Protein involved in polysaccharide export, contains SLBB domain of the beta-grasp fold n=1 Tax=Reichenbachiella faecimaris TaxID=692418 RepID=A0A1W2GCI5_REIFA|nr:SLBB domain-containing protein [Reichenbachiella faecimaris]SMD34321.1 protein involved in polysaccharide export, contains SLBB domain of the beta-grasp fold [Reichenbachiella faecimaris]